MHTVVHHSKLCTVYIFRFSYFERYYDTIGPEPDKGDDRELQRALVGPILISYVLFMH